MYRSAKRLAFSLKNQEIHRKIMVQKADLLKAESKKVKFGKESKDIARKPSEKRREVIQEYVLITTPTGTIIRGSMKYNQYGYHHTKACRIYANCGRKGHLTNRCRTPTN